MDPVIGPVDGDERRAEIAEGGFGSLSDALFGHEDADRSVIRVDYLAVADLVLHPADGMGAEGAVATLIAGKNLESRRLAQVMPLGLYQRQAPNAPD